MKGIDRKGCFFLHSARTDGGEIACFLQVGFRIWREKEGEDKEGHQMQTELELQEKEDFGGRQNKITSLLQVECLQFAKQNCNCSQGSFHLALKNSKPGAVVEALRKRWQVQKRGRTVSY